MLFPKHYLVYIAKITIICIVALLLYKKLSTIDEENIDTVVDLLSVRKNYSLLFLVLLLTLINWFLEALKWKRLISIIEVVSLKKSLQAVLAGIVGGMVTPARIGDFFSRILFLNSGNKTSGLVASLIGGWAQLVITIVFGFFALSLEITFNSNRFIDFLLVFSINLLGVCAVVLFFFPELIFKLPDFIIIKKMKQKLNYLKECNKLILLHVLTISFARYVIFVIQFFILISIFELNIPFITIFTGIALTFISTAFLSYFLPIELGTRELFALSYFENYTDNLTAVLTSVFLLWVCNIAIPGLFGLVVFLRLKFNGK